jgi:hypothetical protein
MFGLSPLDRAAEALTDAQREIASSISSYPTPISGCDAQFNHLLDCRRRLERARRELAQPEFVPTSRNPG